MTRLLLAQALGRMSGSFGGGGGGGTDLLTGTQLVVVAVAGLPPTGDQKEQIYINRKFWITFLPNVDIETMEQIFKVQDI